MPHSAPSHPRTQSQQNWHLDVLVADGFVLLEVAGIVDAIRIANRIIGRQVFTWAYRSATGGPVHSRSDAILNTTPVPHRPEADYVFVVGNSDPDSPALSVGTTIDAYTFRGAQVFLLAEAASRYIKERGDHEGRLSTHWENSVLLQERLGLFQADNALASEDGAIVTCAGMGATVDVVLALIGRHISSANLTVLANVLLHEKIRDYSTRQPFGGDQNPVTGDDKLDQCIEIMQANIEEPVPIRELGPLLNISNRALERRFQNLLHTTPNTYYRELRLSKANNLLLNTSMSMRDIGVACGFPNGFSTLYKSFFGMTPRELRAQRHSLRTAHQTAKSGDV